MSHHRRAHYLYKELEDGKLLAVCEQTGTYQRSYTVGDVLPGEEACRNCMRELIRETINNGHEWARQGLEALKDYAVHKKQQAVV